MNLGQIEMIETSFHKIVLKEAFVDRFYNTLFHAYPALHVYFVNTDLLMQQRKLLFTLLLIIDHLRVPDTIEQHLREIGDLHINQLRISRYEFDAMLEVLLFTLQETLGCAWSDQLESAWREGYQIIIDMMKHSVNAAS